METLSFNLPLNLADEARFLKVISLEATNTVLNITDENNSYSITIPRGLSSRGGAETINTLKHY